MGIGGAPEGVLTAAALKCLGGEIQGSLRLALGRRAGTRETWGWTWTTRSASTSPMTWRRGRRSFSATGVTDGELLQGVRFFGGGARPIRC